MLTSSASVVEPNLIYKFLQPVEYSLYSTSYQQCTHLIVPYGKSSFDLYSLIYFLDSTVQNYISTGVFPTSKYTYLKKIDFLMYGIIRCSKIEKEQKTKHYSVLIEFSKDFENIFVSLKDNINKISLVKQNGTICFKMTPFFLQNSNDLIAPHKFDFVQFPEAKNSMLYQFGNFVAKSCVHIPKLLKLLFSEFQSEKTISRKNKIGGSDDFLNMLRNLQGFIYIVTGKETKGGFNFGSESNKRCLKSLIWLFPWSTKIMKHIQYFQIDASHKPVRPYAYCIYHAIRFNSSYPIALAIHPTEDHNLYELLFIGLKHFELSIEAFENHNVLADMAGCIKTFCNSHAMTRFICHRHLIENFGAHSIFGLWVSRLLRCKTENEFVKMRNEISTEIDLFWEEKEELTQEEEGHMNNLLIMLNSTDDNLNSNYHILYWASWLRREHGMITCTAHAEGCHGNINSRLPKHGRINLATGLNTIAKYIREYMANRRTDYGNQFRKKHGKVLDDVIKILSHNNPENYLTIANSSCDCEDDQYNQCIYGVTYPCIHTILSNIVNSNCYKYLIEKNFGGSLQSFFLFCLNEAKSIHFDFESSKFDANIDGLINIIMKNVTKDDEEVYEKFYIIGYKFIYQFRFVLPQDIDTSNERFNINITNEDFINENIIFNDGETENDDDNSSNNNNWITKIPAECYEEEDEFFEWLNKDCKSEREIYVKHKFQECYREILWAFPKVKKKAASICFSNSVKYIWKGIELNDDSITQDVIVAVARFKINCWIESEMLSKITKEKKKS